MYIYIGPNALGLETLSSGPQTHNAFHNQISSQLQKLLPHLSKMHIDGMRYQQRRLTVRESEGHCPSDCPSDGSSDGMYRGQHRVTAKEYEGRSPSDESHDGIYAYVA